jgi:hypothetical protein
MLLVSNIYERCSPAEKKVTLDLQLRRQVHHAYAEALNSGLKPDAHFLAKMLHLPGFTFQIRSALGSGGNSGGSCLQQLRHFFVTCSATGVLLLEVANLATVLALGFWGGMQCMPSHFSRGIPTRA